MPIARWVVLVLFVLLLAVPLIVRPQSDAVDETARRVIIITPHNEQIRREFGRAFEIWHQAQYGEPARVIWSNPGGTSEIRKMLVSQFEAALADGRDPGGEADLLFGGGSYEHSQLKNEVSAEVDATRRSASISQPIEFTNDFLDDVYGQNSIGSERLYDPELYWFGTALSGFGIVYNRDVLDRLGLPEPITWDDLCHPALRNWLASVNPGQSGSVTTAFDIILQRRGWNEGWRILRRAGANSRYFSGMSSRPPIDVSMGDAAMGVCIDFYGRYQSQSILDAGGVDRIGYVDPPGETTLDPDPISMLRGAPNPQTARRFVEFCLSEAGQALWQYPAGEGQALGPQRFELRRMPVRRSMYVPRHTRHFRDQVRPFEIVQPLENPNRDFRSFIPALFAAMVMDTHEELKEAWTWIITHPEYPVEGGVVTTDQVTDPVLAQMLASFDALPSFDGPAGATHTLAEVHDLATIKQGFLRGGWADAAMWHPDASPTDVFRQRCAAFFKERYRRVVELARQHETSQEDL